MHCHWLLCSTVDPISAKKKPGILFVSDCERVRKLEGVWERAALAGHTLAQGSSRSSCSTPPVSAHASRQYSAMLYRSHFSSRMPRYQAEPPHRSCSRRLVGQDFGTSLIEPWLPAIPTLQTPRLHRYTLSRSDHTATGA